MGNEGGWTVLNLGTSVSFLSFLSSEAPQLSSMFILWLERRSVKEFIVNSAVVVVGDEEEEKLRYLFKIGTDEEEVKKFRCIPNEHINNGAFVINKSFYKRGN